MAKGTKIKAAFSNGVVLTRTTTRASLVNGFGWIIRGKRTPEQAAAWGTPTTGSGGFAGSAELARKQISSFKQYLREVTFEEIVAVSREEI